MSDKEKEGKSDSSSESEKERSESEHESGDKKEKEVKQGESSGRLWYVNYFSQLSVSYHVLRIFKWSNFISIMVDEEIRVNYVRITTVSELYP